MLNNPLWFPVTGTSFSKMPQTNITVLKANTVIQLANVLVVNPKFEMKKTIFILPKLNVDLL